MVKPFPSGSSKFLNFKFIKFILGFVTLESNNTESQYYKIILLFMHSVRFQVGSDVDAVFVRARMPVYLFCMHAYTLEWQVFHDTENTEIEYKMENRKTAFLRLKTKNIQENHCFRIFLLKGSKNHY